MNRNFDAYAEYYDLIYQGKEYNLEADYVLNSLRVGRKSPSTILELGCGTGGHAVCLAQRGVSVHGIDLSVAMIAKANSRLRQVPGPRASKLRFQSGDVRNFRAEEKYDAVISLFHVMCYQVDNSSLVSAFETAAEALRPGGLFVFDYWHGPGVIADRPAERSRSWESGTVAVNRKAKPILSPDKNMVTVRYQIEVVDKTTKQSHRIEEDHQMRYLFVPEIELVSSKWFRPIGHMAWMQKKSLGFEDWLGFSILEKI